MRLIAIAVMLFGMSGPVRAGVLDVTVTFLADNFIDVEGDNTISPVTSLGGSFSFTFDEALAIETNHTFTPTSVVMDPVGDSTFNTSNAGGFIRLNADTSVDQIHFYGLIHPGSALGGADDFVLSSFQNLDIDRFRYGVDEDVDALFWDFDTDIQISITSVPVPASVFLLFAGLVLMGVTSRRRFSFH